MGCSSLNQVTLKTIGIVLLVVAMLSMIYITGEHHVGPSFAEDSILSGLSPVKGFFSHLGNRAFYFFQGMMDYPRLLEENRRLREELAQRENYRYQLVEMQKENYRLREMLDFKERTEYELLPAEVVSRDPAHWFETLTIDKGHGDGVEENMAVVTAEGLVGSVLEVSRNSSRVLLLTDSRRAVSALIQRSRDPGEVGVVEGYPEQQGLLRLINLPPEANIQPGDTIVSSGLGGVFPKGLVIGHALEIEKDQYGLLQRALVRPSVNFNRLEELFIVFETTVDLEGLEELEELDPEEIEEIEGEGSQ